VTGGGTDTLVGKATTDVLTNKTLTTPHITAATNVVFDTPGGFTLSIAATNSGANRVYTLPNTTDDTFVFKASTDTLTNKTLSTPHIASGTNVVFDSAGGGTISIAAASTAGTRVFTLPNTADDTFVLTNATQTLTNKTIASTQVSGLPTFPSGTIVGTTDTQTLTNKAISPRVSTSATGNTTPTPNADTDDVYNAVSMTVNMAFGAPTGTPAGAQKLMIRVQGTAARTLSFASGTGGYRFSTDIAAPTTTTTTKTMYLGFIWNAGDSRWDLVAKTDGF
jgi:hypothetical protein